MLVQHKCSKYQQVTAAFNIGKSAGWVGTRAPIKPLGSASCGTSYGEQQNCHCKSAVNRTRNMSPKSDSVENEMIKFKKATVLSIRVSRNGGLLRSRFVRGDTYRLLFGRKPPQQNLWVDSGSGRRPKV